MLGSYLIGALLIIVLVSLWALIQHRWGKHFSTTDPDGDVLAGRTACGTGQCGCGPNRCRAEERGSGTGTGAKPIRTNSN